MKNVLGVAFSGAIAMSSVPAIAAGKNICEVQTGARTGVTQVINRPIQGNIPNIQFSTDQNTFSEFSGHKTKYRLPNKLEDNSLKVYFITDQAALDNGDKADLDNFVESLKSSTGEISITLEGYADARGKTEKNDRISQKRAQSVKDYLIKELGGSVNINIISYGETDSNGLEKAKTLEEKLALRKDRKVSISINNDIVSTALRKNPADIYLLDASASMRGEKWESVKNYNFEKGTKVFTFTSQNQQGCATTIGEQKVNGGTPLYESLLELVSEPISKGKTITLLSDGEASTLLLERVIQTAKENNTEVNVIGISSFDRESLTKLATETGGKYYFQGN